MHQVERVFQRTESPLSPDFHLIVKKENGKTQPWFKQFFHSLFKGIVTPVFKWGV
jgi:hypothetical protein